MLADVKVLVLGLGDSGLAMARWCVRQGATVRVADTRETPPGLAALRQELPGVAFTCAPMDAGLLEPDTQLVLKSPGLSPLAVAPLAKAARSLGLRLGGELSLFAQALARLREQQGYRPRMLAVTGTNGKTTVTALTGSLVERCGRRVAVAGNIGPTLLDTLAGALDNNNLPEVWVLELSSFQLDEDSLDSGLFEPTAAAILNLSQDHLDWHGSMAAYGAAKARILGRQALAVLNREDPAVLAMLQAAPNPRRAPNKPAPARGYVSFGGDLPQRPGDYGIETVNGMAWLVRAQPEDAAPRRRGAREAQAPAAIFVQRLMPAEALRIRGRHNALNALAALALAQAGGCTLAPTLHGLREYRGEPHRVEPVAVVHEVEYFDDSKGTNVGATVAALNGLGAERRLVLILGGDGKGQDFAPLAEPVARHVRQVLLIGRDAPLLRSALSGSGVPLVDAVSMDQAVTLASQAARAGDAVLMSPACASFDMFRNYGHRAQVFRDAVTRLAEEAGLVMEHGA